MKRSAKAEALLIAVLKKEEVATHRGETKPVRERVYSTSGRDARVTEPEREKKQRKGR